MSILFTLDDDTAGKITLRHIYEIAKIKQGEGSLEHVTLKGVCKMLIGQCHSMGIEVLKGDLNVEEYGEFLVERRRLVQEQDDLRAEEKAAKLLRLS